MKKQLSFFDFEEKPEMERVINVSTVPQRSPFRYPGGKTWLIPIIRKWLQNQKTHDLELIEPFAGGAIVSLTAAFENLAQKITMIEKDEEVAAVWDIIINGDCEWLANKILNFELTHENVNKEFAKPNKQLRDIAFCTILKNRTFHGGIIAKGSSFLKNGENGKGILSRWYPNTLYKRLMSIKSIRTKIKFITGDAFEIIQENRNNKNAFFFLDPPYAIAGKRLYTYFEIDHENLFRNISQIKGSFMLTYDDTSHIRDLSDKFKLKYKTIPMKTTHHLEKREIIISDNFRWWD